MEDYFLIRLRFTKFSTMVLSKSCDVCSDSDCCKLHVSCLFEFDLELEKRLEPEVIDEFCDELLSPETSLW